MEQPYNDKAAAFIKPEPIYRLASTPIFDKWLIRLKDKPTKNKVLARLNRVENGNFGDHKSLGNGLFELRCKTGAGLRIYYTKHENMIVLLLSGGNKSTQERDIKKAQKILGELE